MMKEKFQENYGMTVEELVDIDFEISVTSTSSDADIIVEVSGHVDIDDEEEYDNEGQPTDCIWKRAFKDIINAITVLEDYSLFSKFATDLMKAFKDVNCAFDLDCLTNKKQSTIKNFLQLCKHLIIKRKTRRKKLNSAVSLILTLIFSPWRFELERLSIIRISL